MVEAPRILQFYNIIKNTIGKIKNINGVQKDKFDIVGKKIVEWIFAGKNLLFKMNDNTFMVAHFCMYGKLVLNGYHPKNKEKNPSLEIKLDSDDIIRYYTTSLKIIDKKVFDEIDFRYREKLDITHPNYDENILIKHWLFYQKEKGNLQISDFLLNQSIGVGIGNILQIEALYYAEIHPLSKTKKLNLNDFKNIIKGIKVVIDKILNNEKYLIYHKKYCPKNHKSTTKYLGIYNRRMNYCNQCQLIK